MFALNHPRVKYWSDKFNALSKRERCMVFVAGLAVIYGLLNLLVLTPATIEADRLKASLKQIQTEMYTLKLQIAHEIQEPVHNQNTENQQEIDAISASIRKQQAALTKQEHALLTADQMGDLLDGLLRQSSGVRLMSMSTLPATSLLVKDKSGNTRLLSEQEAVSVGRDLQTLIYRHAIQMTIAGSYFDLMHYVENMEKLPHQLRWKQASLVSKGYPQNELTIEVYTLGLDNTWLNL